MLSPEFEHNQPRLWPCPRNSDHIDLLTALALAQQVLNNEDSRLHLWMGLHPNLAKVLANSQWTQDLFHLLYRTSLKKIMRRMHNFLRKSRMRFPYLLTPLFLNRRN